MKSNEEAARKQRFTALWDASYLDVLRFVRRRVDPTDAEDVVGEVMLVAWRRLDDVPDDNSEARAWIFGVARMTLQNARRREDRQRALVTRLSEITYAPPVGQSPEAIAERLDVSTAWPQLSALHQEAIALTVFDGLSGHEAAMVLGISDTAFRLRLSRARRALRRHLSNPRPDRSLLGESNPVRST